MSGMPLLNEVKTSIANLSASELADFRRWFDEFDADQWDRQFEQDASTGKLNTLARKALETLQKGQCDEL